MGSYSIKYDNGIETDTLENIKRSYNFVIEAMRKHNSKIVVRSQQFQLDIGKVNAVIKDYNEFLKSSFGQEISLTQIDIHFELYKVDYATVYIKPRGAYGKENSTVVCSDMGVLENIISVFDEYKQELIERDSQNITTIYQGDHIEIKDNANVVDSNIGGNQNQVNDYFSRPAEPVKKEKSSFIKAICANIVSNWLGWAIGIIVTAIFLKWGIKL